jgi:type II secretory pathway pseudopilin PulG
LRLSVFLMIVLALVGISAAVARTGTSASVLFRRLHGAAKR